MLLTIFWNVVGVLMVLKEGRFRLNIIQELSVSQWRL